MVQTKMASLLRAYKAAVDNEGQTGAAPCVAPYMEVMGDLYGDKPIIGNSHTINMYGQQAAPLEVPVCNNIDEDCLDADASNIAGSSNSSSSPSAAKACTQKAGKKQKKSPAHTFRRRVNVKEVMLNKRLVWEREKQQRKEDLVLKIEAERQKRHEQTQEKLEMLINFISKNQK